MLGLVAKALIMFSFVCIALTNFRSGCLLAAVSFAVALLYACFLTMFRGWRQQKQVLQVTALRFC